jgi:sugar transferase (PEP-CTERM/EpsH1 system associated)
MRILFVSSRFPYPPLQGDRVRAYHQLRVLSRRHRITLVTPAGRQDASLDAVRPFCERVEAVTVPAWRRALNLAKAPASRLPWQTVYWFTSALARAVRRVAAQDRFDLAHVQLVRMAPAGLCLNGTPKVLDMIDALSLNFARRAKREAGLRALALAREAKRLRDYERHLLGLFERILISSDVDGKFIGGGERIHVIANGVDIESFPFHAAERDPDTVIFTGRMGYFPNADGAIWFATQVFPKIRCALPRARFAIVGADPPARVRALACIPGVEVTGYVPGLSQALRRASVAVAPLLAGSGIQNKVLEAMASGTPVVATPYSLGGLKAQHEKHLLLASTAAGFAAAVTRLMRDRALGAELARNAREMVESRYTWEHSVAALQAVYDLAVEQRRRAGSPLLAASGRVA